MLKAMRKVHRAIADRDGTFITMQVHDELVVETLESEATAVAAVVEECMTAAWTELFPEGPTTKLVDMSIRKCWAKPEKEGVK
jgi:DNA polymerase I-like protein with 3'-5' exonuclease and polymerase domains